MNLGHWATQPAVRPASHVRVLHHARGLDDVAWSDPSGQDIKWRFDQDLPSLLILQINPEEMGECQPTYLFDRDTGLKKVSVYVGCMTFPYVGHFCPPGPTHLFLFCENSFKEPRHVRVENEFSQPRK